MQEDYSSWLAFKMLVSSDKQMEMRVKIKFSRQVLSVCLNANLRRQSRRKGEATDCSMPGKFSILTFVVGNCALFGLSMDDLSEHV